MYRKSDREQLMIEDFIIPFGGKLDAENRWVKMAKLMPWEMIEDLYAQNFKSDRTDGRPPYSARIAFGAIFIKEHENLTDERTVGYISENPYMQYFLGLHEFTTEPLFDPSLMVSFRKRISAEDISKVNEELYRRMSTITNNDDDKNNKNNDGSTHNDNNTGNENQSGDESSKNKGIMKVDATCAPSDIRYPQDLSLLNECRENTEKIIAYIWARAEIQHGHMTDYNRKKARKAYLKIAKQRSPRRDTMRKAIGEQLEYLRKNQHKIAELLCITGFDILSEQQIKRLDVIGKIYEQQKEMYDNHTNKCEDRIISVRQPFVRVMVRGKAGKKYEFGQKLEFSVVDGFTFIERQEWDPYNESKGLIECIERYRARTGVYPEAVQVDQIYRTKENRAFCKEKGIRISGIPLGRPKKDEIEAHRERAYQDSCERNEVESKNGISKRRYGLDLIMAYLDETAKTEAALNVLAMNVAHCLRRLLRAYYYMRYTFDILDHCFLLSFMGRNCWFFS